MTSGHLIRDGLAEDSECLFAMMREAFGENYLGFSIYQAPQAIHYFRRVIQGRTRTNDLVRLELADEVTRGFYSAVVRNGEIFLNYIATSQVYRGLSIGSALLLDFEETGRQLGCSAAGIGVFESNDKAYEWYLRHGYSVSGSRFVARYRIERVPRSHSESVEIEAQELRDALVEERNQGFAKLAMRCTDLEALVGLIDTNVLNIMQPRDSGAYRAARDAVRVLGRGRRWLLLNLLEPPSQDLGEPERTEKAVYLTKQL